MSVVSRNALLILATALVPVYAQYNPLGYKDFKLDFAGGVTVGILISVFCICLGLFYLIVGARYPKASIASNTFIFLAGILFFTLNYFDVDSLTSLIVGLVVGFLAIGLALKIWRVGLFILGGGAGFVIWLVVKGLAHGSFNDEITIYVSLSVVILVVALAALKFEKQSFIVATSLIGSFILVQGVDALIPGHASVFSMISDTSGLVCSYDQTWCIGIYVAVFVIALLGALIQFKVTAKYYKKKTEKNKSNFRRRRRGKKQYASEADQKDPRRKYRENKEHKDEDRAERKEPRERKHSDEGGGHGGSKISKLQQENAELKTRNRDLETKNQELQTAIALSWDLAQDEKDLVTRYRTEKADRLAEEQRLAEEREREAQEEEARAAAKRARKAEKREKEREREREREREAERDRLRREEEEAFNVKKSTAKKNDDPPPYASSAILREEPKGGGGKKGGKKKRRQSEKKRRDSDSDEESAEG